jgi:hypothetical protein
MLGAVAAVVLFAAVGAFILLGSSNSWDPGVEPSPVDTWSAFTAPDNSWSVLFPGTMSPMTMSQDMDTGFGTTTVKMWATTDGAVVYEAAAIDLPSEALAGDTGSLLDQFQQGMLIGAGGRITGSRSLTFQSHEAREVKFTEVSSMKFDGYGRFWLVNARLYLLMVMAKPGSTMYPEHFFDSFNVK